MSSKVDLSLDDIIALNRRQASTQKNRGRGGSVGRGGRGRGRGRGGGRRASGQQQPGGVAEGKPGGLSQRRWKTKGKAAQSQKDTVANVRTRSQQKAQQLRQKARQTLFNKRRNQTQQQQQKLQSQQLEMDKEQRTPSGTGVKQRLGVTSARGRGRGVGVRGRGRGRGSSQAQLTGAVQASTSRPGSQLKNIRNTKALVRGRGRGGRGRSPGGSLARQALSQLAEQQSPGTKTPQRGRGRGGRGRGLRRPGSLTPSGSTNIQLTVVQDPEEFEPIGVELPHDFAIQHHTTKSLNVRFTPKTDQKSTQRFIHQGDRAVNFES